MIKALIALSLVVAVLGLASAPKALAYDPFNSICQGTANNSTFCQGKGDNTQNPLLGSNGLLFGIAKILAFVAGLSAVITIVVSAFRLASSGGDPATVKTARQAIIAALVGIAIILLGGSIISLVVSRV